jgi:CheY-like chemotaxis protein
MNDRDAADPGAPDQAQAEAAGAAALRERIGLLESDLARARAEFASFSSRLSHDMQGVLRNIDGFAGALQQAAGGKFTEKEARFLERIQATAQRGDSLMRDLAALSAAAVAPLQPGPVDLARLVDQCIRDLAPTLAGRDVQWELVGAPWPRVAADPGLLRLALDHLLANAVKFTRGCAAARIRVAVATTPQEWVLTVADNGAGFDDAYVARLFHPFERLHLPTEFEGNGVGLAVVKTVAQRHGGRVEAQAPPQGGAVFTMTLRQPAGPVAAAPRAAGAAAARGRPGPSLRILVVDDDPMVLATVRMMLERDGHDVVTAGGGAAALQVLARQPPEPTALDLVVCDWLMPQVSGAEVAQAAKACQPALRVVVLTGQRPGIDGGYQLPAAVDVVLGKPVTPAQLRQAVALATGSDPAQSAATTRSTSAP